MIEKLRLRGSIGILRGLGLDEIEVDFTGRTGLLALDGANGAGKTSFLDNLHPYDCLASREGALKNHFYLRDSLKELTFTHGGHSYRTLIKIDATSGKSEGFAYIDRATESVTKGSISEYHKWAVTTFGSQELFFAAQFEAQNSRKVSDMRVGELKSLFVEFLRLERLERWAKTAGDCVNVLGGKVGGLGGRIDNLDDVICFKAHRLEELEALVNQELPATINAKEMVNNRLKAKREEIDALKETISKNALALERKKDLQGQIERLEGELAKEKEAAAEEIRALTLKWTALGVETKGCDFILVNKGKIEKAAETQRDLENSLVVLQVEIDRLAVEQSEYQGKVHVAETDLSTLKTQLKDLATDPENLRLGKIVEEAEGAVKDREREVAALDKDPKLAALEAEIESLERAALVGDGIDETCKSTTCAAIQAVNVAKAKLPYVTADMVIRKDEIKGLMLEALAAIEDIKERAAITFEAKATRVFAINHDNHVTNEEIKQKTHDLRNLQQVALSTAEFITARRQDLAKARLEVAQQKALADRLPEIQIAEARKADLEKQLAEVTEQGTAKKKAWEEKEKSIKFTISILADDQCKLVIDYLAEESLQMVQADIKEIETVKLPALEKEIQSTRDEITTLQNELTKIEAAEIELEQVRAEREALTKKIGNWKYLQIACGKKGIQALEIDGAAPLISSRANELLHFGYGPQFSVRIDTQDEEGREDLDIKVLSEHGEDSLKMKSGGERIWLLHPIRLSMVLLARDKSGREWDMAFFDEITGALDSKGSTGNFMAMYRPFMELGHINQVFYISHQEECLAYADHVLQFKRGEGVRWL